MSGLYEQVLRQVEKGAALPLPKPPRASASVVLWRRSGGALEVYWLQRSSRLRFMGGFHAFPGGGVSRTDVGVSVQGRPLGIEGASPEAAMPVAVIEGVELGPILIPGLLAATLRELFEETGLLLAAELVDRSAVAARTARLAAARAEVEARQLGFDEMLAELELTADAGRLVYAGRWLTPPLGPLRFDNRFFLLEWPVESPQQPVVVPGEAESGEWVTPADALSRWRQGEITTAPPILHVLQTLDEQGPSDGLDRLREPFDANLGPHRLIEFRPGVLLFPLRTPTLPPAAFTNCYLLGLEEAVLVDPGSSHEEEIDRLAAALEVVQSAHSRRITAIWLTHHHPDHIGGVEAMRRKLGVPVAAHAETAARLAGLGLSIDEELADGQLRSLEGRSAFPVRVMHTPGHARGHLCFLDETFGSLLAGDLVAGHGTIVIDPPEGNMVQYLRSLEAVRALAPRALFPAHGPMTMSPGVKLDEYLEHRRWREERILAVWRSGVREIGALREEVYSEVPPMAHPLAERQIHAHLEHLEADGRLED